MEAAKKSPPWGRIGCATVSLAALYTIFHRLSLDSLALAFRTLHLGWFLTAIVLFGLLFLPAAWRWHLVLRLNSLAVHPGASARLSLIGHFFYTILFGALGGDAAKGALYARWYGLPLPEVLASAPLDRLLGFFGLLLFGASTLAITITAGGFDLSQPLAIHRPGLWFLLLAASGIVASFLGLKARAHSVWSRFSSALVSGGKRLLEMPHIALIGTLCGLLVQLALSGVLMLNLQAVSHAPLPWGRMLWTFPVIALVSGLPITIAGLGTREGAALVLLPMYGVPSDEAVAASLLTSAVNLIWAAIGAILLWREGRWQKQPRPVPLSISVIIPTLNEAANLAETVHHVRALFECCEVIIADGGSRDRTCEIGIELGCQVIHSPPGRGGQMGRGASKARGDVILLLHADTWLPPGAGAAILNSLRDKAVVGGGCWKSFRERSPLLLGSRLKCAIRLYLGHRIMGDQAMFVRREVLEVVGGVPDMPLMEEFELCRRLRKVGRLALADTTILTSARRFARLGVGRTYARMWWVTLRYWLGATPQDLQRIYEKK